MVPGQHRSCCLRVIEFDAAALALDLPDRRDGKREEKAKLDQSPRTCTRACRWREGESDKTVPSLRTSGEEALEGVLYPGGRSMAKTKRVNPPEIREDSRVENGCGVHPNATIGPVGAGLPPSGSMLMPTAAKFSASCGMVTVRTPLVSRTSLSNSPAEIGAPSAGINQS